MNWRYKSIQEFASEVVEALLWQRPQTAQNVSALKAADSVLRNSSVKTRVRQK